MGGRFIYARPAEMVALSPVEVSYTPQRRHRRSARGSSCARPARGDAPKPRLLDRVRQAIAARHYSRRTEKAYVHWIKRYIFFHGKLLRNYAVGYRGSKH